MKLSSYCDYNSRYKPIGLVRFVKESALKFVRMRGFVIHMSLAPFSFNSSSRGVFRSVNAKTNLVLIVVITVVFLIFGLYDYQTSQTEMMNELNEFADFSVQELSRLLSNPVWNVDNKETERIIETSMRDKRIYAIVVIEEDGHSIFAGARRTSDWSIVHDVKANYDGNYIERAANFVVEKSGYNVGSVRLFVTTQFLTEELQHEIFMVAFRMLLLELILVISISVFLRFLLTKPLSSLAAMAQQVTEAEDYSIRVPQSSNDQIGMLIESFNTMLSVVEERDRQLKGSRNLLEEQVLARTAELIRKNKLLAKATRDATAANRAKGEFLANMSHEIRTPMNAVIGMSEIALSSEKDEKQRERLRIIRTSARSLLGLINDILDFSKIEAGKLELESIVFRLRDCLDEVVDIFREKMACSGVELIVHIDPEVPGSLRGDPLRLRQVLINLTGNAYKFTQTGEINITVSTRHRNADIVELCFEIRDTGIGISPKQAEALFEPFSQGDGSITRRYGGTGLGLAICKTLVELMSGTISANGKQGKGSVFQFTAKMHVENAASHFPSNVSMISGMHILVVDDSEYARFVMEKLLEGFEMTVETVDSAELAIKRLNDITLPQFQLIITDWKLPGKDGIEFIQEIRQHKPLASIPVILMTAYGREREFRQANDAGTNGFLIKPIKQSMLFDSIMAVLGNPTEASTGFDNESFSSQELRGAHILLVEDNEVNQTVARAILEEFGIQVEVASNGAQAVQVILETHFDAVLMDIQMPVLDGLEATRRIRSDSRFAELPIIAMTAHAMKEDKDECLQAGMNDYVKKPIDQRVLYEKLRKWVQYEPLDPTPVSEQASSKSNSVSENFTVPPDLDGFDVAQGVTRLGGRHSMYAQVLFDFVRLFSEVDKELHLALDQGKVKKVREIAHRVVGAAGNVAAVRLHDVACDIERMVDKDDLERSRVLAERFEHELKVVQASINRLNELKKRSDPLKPDENANRNSSFVMDSASMDAVFQELEERLADYDPVGAVRCLDKCIGGNGYDFDMLRQKINDYEFDAALEDVGKFRKSLLAAMQ